MMNLCFPLELRHIGRPLEIIQRVTYDKNTIDLPLTPVTKSTLQDSPDKKTFHIISIFLNVVLLNR